MLGGRLGFNPFEWLFGLFFVLPMEIQVGALLGLMVALVVGYFVRKPARQREAARLEAEIRAERARRGKAPSA
jgi:hypothetical protein